MTRVRADELLVERGLAESRSRAKALIAAGLVSADGITVSKPAQAVKPDAELALRRRDHSWVSRAGVKLAHALDRFGFDPAGRVCLDIGASTGGFAEVLLSRASARVYAVEVGHGQLHERLRRDPRLVSLERLNARDLTAALVPEPIGAITCDVSFISLKKALPPALTLAAPDAWLVALIKPQFEAGRAALGKGGVVRDPAVHRTVCDDVRHWLAAQAGWHVIGLIESPITGSDGNREFLIAARKDGRS